MTDGSRDSTVPVPLLLFVWQDGDTDLYESVEDAALDLEFFDSEVYPMDGDEVLITDALGRRLRMRAEKGEVVYCDVADSDEEA